MIQYHDDDEPLDVGNSDGASRRLPGAHADHGRGCGSPPGLLRHNAHNQSPISPSASGDCKCSPSASGDCKCPGVRLQGLHTQGMRSYPSVIVGTNEK